MQITFQKIAGEIGISNKTLSIFISGGLRSELVCRKISEFTRLSWRLLQSMPSDKLEATVLRAYLDKHFPCAQNGTLDRHSYENQCVERV